MLDVVDLATIGLSPAALLARQGGLGGSDANILLGGDEAKILQLYLQKRGEAEAEDLSGILAVIMGSFTETLNAAWFTKQTGLKVTNRGMVLASQQPDLSFMRCTLDGLVASEWTDVETGEINGTELGVWEAKHCGTFGTDLELFQRYVPQLTHNCIVAGETRAWLSIFRGNSDWLMFEYEVDPAYAARLIEAERAFWDCVVYGQPPYDLPDAEPTPKPVGIVEYDMAGSNLWGHFAGEYIDTMLAAERHESARVGLKELVPDDASRAFGHGLQIKRSKNGALRFSFDNGGN